MASMVSRIRWNTLFYSLSFFIRLLTNFLLFVGIARFYGPETFGQFTAAHTMSTLFILFADFGFDMLLTNEIPRQRERAAELVQRFLSIKLLFCVAATAVMFFLPYFQGTSPETRSLVGIFSFYVLCSALVNFFFALFRGLEQMHVETRISFVINVLLVGMLVVAGIYHLPVSLVAIAFVASRFLGLILAFYATRSSLALSGLRFSLSEWRSVWGMVATFGFTFIFGNLFFMLDTILLSCLRGDAEVGVYQSVFKIVALVLIVPDILTTTLMPVLSRLHTENVERWDLLGMLLNKTLLFVGMSVSIVLFVYADQIIRLLYGVGRYEAAVPVLRTFSVIVLIRYVAETSALMLTTSERQRVRMWIVVGATGLNAILNLLLIPAFGVQGAAMVSLVTNIVVGVGYIVGRRLRLFAWLANMHTLVPAAILIVSAIVLWQFRAASLWVGLPFVVIMFALVIYRLGFTGEERRLIFAQGRSIQ